MGCHFSWRPAQALCRPCISIQAVYFALVRQFRSPECIPDTRTNITLSVPPPLFDFSHNTALRSLEIPFLALPPPDSHTRTVMALATIISPVFSEVVVVFSGIGCWQRQWAGILGDMCKVKQFRVVFCLQTSEVSRAQSLQRLISYTGKAVAEGAYDFLPCPPVICSRPVSSFDIFCQRLPIVA